MILQVIFDDQFGNYALEQFKCYSDKVHFVLLTTRENEIAEFIKKTPQLNVVVYLSHEYKQLLTNLSKYKAVLMHGLFDKAQYDIVRHLPPNVKLAWVLWGGEIYFWKESTLFQLAPLTRCVAIIKEWKDTIFGVHEAAARVPLDVLQRVDYMLGSSLEIFEEAKTYIKNLNMKHLMYSYFTLERLIGEDLLDKTVNGNNILLGNSSALENNHLDILMQIWRVGLPTDAKLITPLAYNTPWVKNMVNKIGKLLFENQFFPILSFLPRLEYNNLVQSCSVFIANHHNPNAFGNVLTALWLGARVYSSKDNVQTKFLQRLGLHVNIIEKDLNKKNPNLFTPLSEYEREDNRRVIKEIYGRDQMRKNIQYIIDILNT